MEVHCPGQQHAPTAAPAWIVTSIHRTILEKKNSSLFAIRITCALWIAEIQSAVRIAASASAQGGHRRRLAWSQKDTAGERANSRKIWRERARSGTFNAIRQVTSRSAYRTGEDWEAVDRSAARRISTALA